METDFRPEVGLKFMFTSKPYPQHNFDGKVYCEVLEVTPPEKLAYSWKSNLEEGVYHLDTIVTWTLTPNENGTELAMVQTGFKEGINDVALVSMTGGWHSMVTNKLAALLNEAVNEHGTN